MHRAGDSKGFWQWHITYRITEFLSSVLEKHKVSDTGSVSILKCWGRRHLLCWVPSNELTSTNERVKDSIFKLSSLLPFRKGTSIHEREHFRVVQGVPSAVVWVSVVYGMLAYELVNCSVIKTYAETVDGAGSQIISLYKNYIHTGLQNLCLWTPPWDSLMNTEIKDL
jgi:hypothetical protein